MVHEKAPHIKSLMIAGPRGVGKKMLVNAICTESGANMFDLTPGNIALKYPGKAGLNMLLHMVFKVYIPLHMCTQLCTKSVVLDKCQYKLYVHVLYSLICHP